jgi:hypothetical protein
LKSLQALTLTLAALLASGLAAAAETKASPPYLSDEVIPLRLFDFPERPRALFEIGDPFLGRGKIRKPWTLPTGAVWAPSFLIYGTLRSAAQSVDNGRAPRSSEWANRLDLFGNMQLAATERILLGFRPFDQVDNGVNRFSGYTFEPAGARGFNPEFRAAPTTLFFEGEVGEMFPRLDKNDRRSLDYGLSIGRQPLTLQDGILVNDDSIDLLGVTRDHLQPSWASKLKVSAIFGWSQIERADNLRDPGAGLYALSAYADFSESTVEADLAYVSSKRDADGVYAGLGAVQRLGRFGSTLRVNASLAPGRKTSRIQNGTVLSAELNHGVGTRSDYVYLNGFWGIDRFSSADRGPTAGGPLGRTGLLFSAVGLGQYGAPLSNQVDHAAGGALGYQWVLADQVLRRRLLVFELGGRAPTSRPTLLRQRQAGGAAVRFQQAFGKHVVAIVDLFVAAQKTASISNGGRLELAVKF